MHLMNKILVFAVSLVSSLIHAQQTDCMSLEDYNYCLGSSGSYDSDFDSEGLSCKDKADRCFWNYACYADENNKPRKQRRVKMLGINMRDCLPRTCEPVQQIYPFELCNSDIGNKTSFPSASPTPPTLAPSLSPSVSPTTTVPTARTPTTQATETPTREPTVINATYAPSYAEETTPPTISSLAPSKSPTTLESSLSSKSLNNTCEGVPIEPPLQETVFWVGAIFSSVGMVSAFLVGSRSMFLRKWLAVTSLYALSFACMGVLVNIIGEANPDVATCSSAQLLFFSGSLISCVSISLCSVYDRFKMDSGMKTGVLVVVIATGVLAAILSASIPSNTQDPCYGYSCRASNVSLFVILSIYTMMVGLVAVVMVAKNSESYKKLHLLSLGLLTIAVLLNFLEVIAFAAPLRDLSAPTNSNTTFMGIAIVLAFVACIVIYTHYWRELDSNSSNSVKSADYEVHQDVERSGLHSDPYGSFPPKGEIIVRKGAPGFDGNVVVKPDDTGALKRIASGGSSVLQRVASMGSQNFHRVASAGSQIMKNVAASASASGSVDDAHYVQLNNENEAVDQYLSV